MKCYFRFEILDYKFVPFTVIADYEAFTDLGMLYAKIKMGNNGQFLNLLCTHL